MTYSFPTALIPKALTTEFREENSSWPQPQFFYPVLISFLLSQERFILSISKALKGYPSPHLKANLLDGYPWNDSGTHNGRILYPKAKYWSSFGTPVLVQVELLLPSPISFLLIFPLLWGENQAYISFLTISVTPVANLIKWLVGQDKIQAFLPRVNEIFRDDEI